MPVLGQTTHYMPQTLEAYRSPIWQDNFYMTAGWHDGGRWAGFFLPGIWHDANSHIWWDTGFLLKGSGMGYRTMLDSKHFYGIYAYYDIMSMDNWLTPFRVNVGGELSKAYWGTVTVNGYGILADSERPKLSYDVGGISAKVLFDIWTNLKPLIASSYSYVKFKRGEEVNMVPSFVIGAKWIFSNAFDIEVHNVWDQHQSSWHAGFQIRWDGRKPKSNYFKHRFNSPPDRYIPYYANSKALITRAQQVSAAEKEDIIVHSKHHNQPTSASGHLIPKQKGSRELSYGDSTVSGHLERKMTDNMDARVTRLNKDVKEYTTETGMHWTGMGKNMSKRHPKDELLEVSRISDDTPVYLAGSIEALQYSTMEFFAGATDAVIREFYKHFDIGFHKESSSCVLYPITGIEMEQKLLKSSTGNSDRKSSKRIE